MRYFLGLGSNLGNKKKNLRQAVSLLKEEGVVIFRLSSLYRTQPVGFLKQPWFLNQVIEVATELNPFFLFKLVKNIERKMKRLPSTPKGPRRIDIDILLAEDLVIQTEDLVIPHPRLAERNFVLAPLCEIAPKAFHPLLKEKIEDLWKKTKDFSKVKRIKENSRN